MENLKKKKSFTRYLNLSICLFSCSIYLYICMKYVLYLHEYWWDATPKVNKMDESSLLGLQVTQSFFKLHYIFIHRRPFWHLKTQFVTRASCFVFCFLNIFFKSFIIYNSLRNTLMGWFDNAYTIWNMRFFNKSIF